jgi:ubiquitin-protein ligase
MAVRLAKVIHKHFQKAVADQHPNLLFMQDEEDARIVYLAVVGMPFPHVGCEYFFQLTAPDTFPHAPPTLSCLTDNGVFMTGGAICISVGEFHAKDTAAPSAAAGHQGDWGWSPAMGIRGFAVEVFNGLVAPEMLNEVKHKDSGQGGLGILDSTPARIAELAKESADYNMSHNSGLRMRLLYAPAQAAAVTWERQRAVENVITSLDQSGSASRELIATALGDEIAASIPADQPQLAATLCEFEASYRRGILECLTADTTETLVAAATKHFQFAAASVRKSVMSADDLKAAVVQALRANMRRDFDDRDAILARIDASPELPH